MRATAVILGLMACAAPEPAPLDTDRDVSVDSDPVRPEPDTAPAPADTAPEPCGITFPCPPFPTPIGDAASVLFVGNSLTTQLHRVLTTVAPGLTADQAVQGGLTLAQHLDRPETLAAVAEGADVVLLQEQSAGPAVWGSGPPALALAQLAADAGAQAWLVMTWGYDGVPLSRERVIDASWWWAAETGLPVVAIGEAWHAFLSQDAPPFRLFRDDRHQNARGAYLNAVVVYAWVTGRSPVGLPSGDLDPAQAAILQQVAWDTWQRCTQPDLQPPTPGAVRHDAVSAELVVDRATDDRLHLDLSYTVLVAPPGGDPRANGLPWRSERGGDTTAWDDPDAPRALRLPLTSSPLPAGALGALGPSDLCAVAVRVQDAAGNLAHSAVTSAPCPIAAGPR